MLGNTALLRSSTLIVACGSARSKSFIILSSVSTVVWLTCPVIRRISKDASIPVLRTAAETRHSK